MHSQQVTDAKTKAPSMRPFLQEARGVHEASGIQ